jgi:cbb3-type cytochrome oxidase subunit 3
MVDFLEISFLKNLLTGIVKLIIAITSASVLVALNALYNLILCMTKLISISENVSMNKKDISMIKKGISKNKKYVSKNKKYVSKYKEYASKNKKIQKFILTLKEYDMILQFAMSIAILILGIILILFGLHIYNNGDNQHFNEVGVYAIAAGTFIKLGVSVYGTVNYRHNKNEFIFIAKLTNFVDALYSLVITQCALLYMTETENVSKYNGTFGIFMGVIIVVIGIWLILRISNIKEFKNQCNNINLKSY